LFLYRFQLYFTMAKINNKLIYGLENLPSLLDYLIGSKDVNGKTKNFSLQSIINLINGVNGVNAIQYKFFNETTPDVDFTTPGAMFTNNNETDVNNFSSLIFNKSTLGNYDLSVLFNFLLDLDNLYIGIDNPSNPNNFFTFKVTSISDQTDYFVFAVEPYNGLYIGELTNGLIYSIYWETKEWMSEITEIETELDTKLNHGGYTGTGQDLKNEIDSISTDLDTNYYTKPEVDSKVSSVYRYKGNVPTYADLPTSGRIVGDVWNALDTDINWAWTGTVWDNLGGMFDVSGKEDKTNKQNSLIPDGTGIKYITVDATIGGLNGKLDKGTYTGNAGDLKTDIDNIYQPDTLISSVAPTRAGNTFTYPALGYTALISKTTRTNPSQFVTTIDVATTDFKRVDLIYFKNDNTIAKIVGTESQTVAIRPDVPANAVGISFINVFGNVISDPTPITKEISIQNGFGIEQFKIADYLRFENVSFNPAEKRIVVEGLTPLSVFIDIVNGNDATAVLESYKKPFKTFEAMMLALPAYNEETYTIYSFGGTIPILRRINIRNLEFVGIKATTLDFTNCKEDDGTTIPQNVLRKLHSFTNTFWTFSGFNISIVSNNTNDVIFKYNSLATDTVHVLGYINSLIWQGAPTQNVASFNTGSLSNFIINAVYDTGASGKILSCYGNIVINSFIVSRGIAFFYFANTAEIKNVTKANTGTTGNVYTCLGSGGGGVAYIKIGNIDINRPFLVRCTTIEFNNTVASATNISLGDADLIIGRILSGTGSVEAGSYTKNVTLRNFNGKLAESVHHVSGQITFENCFITVDNTLVSRYHLVQASTIQQCVTFKGNNTIVQTNPANDLIANVNLPISIVIQGAISTNAVSFGRYTTYTQNTATFKEKLNEVVIRSKKDLINRVLSSNTTYIIDGVITLLTGEYIEVPINGLTITGYGFNASSISKNISGQSIFISPAGNSGDFISKDISYSPGLGTVFNLTDATGSHAIELNDINFQGVTGSALGVFNGYRQFTGTTCGFYGLSDGLTLEGNWSGFKLTNSNIIGFGASGTLFKKGSATVFSNRFYIDLNIQVATGSKICDFGPTNLTNDKSLQVVNCYTKVNGVINASLTSVLFPNIAETSSKAYFVNNIGVKNSYNTPYGINTANMLTYADDTAAAAGGVVQIGDTYIESTSGYFKTRLS
jgi:hypothetical protein